MRKNYVLLASVFLLLMFLLCQASPAALWDPAKQVKLGFDHLEMLWYILDYGIQEDGIPFAVARKYYTNEQEKGKIVKLLMEKFGYDKAFAEELNFTEYKYEYTEDGKQFAEAYVRHCDRWGNELHVTVYDNSTEAAKKTFVPVAPDHAVGKGLTLALSKKE